MKLTTFIIVCSAIAQNTTAFQRCGVQISEQEMQRQETNFQAIMNKNFNSFAPVLDVTINVQYHVIYDSDGRGKIHYDLNWPSKMPS
jgi:flagellar biosynthesis/type III secretory pathway chaperone